MPENNASVWMYDSYSDTLTMMGEYVEGAAEQWASATTNADVSGSPIYFFAELVPA